MVHEFNYELEVIKALARKIGIEPLVSLDDDNLSVTIRSDGATKFIFINNYDEIDRTSTISYNGKTSVRRSETHNSGKNVVSCFL